MVSPPLYTRADSQMSPATNSNRRFDSSTSALISSGRSGRGPGSVMPRLSFETPISPSAQAASSRICSFSFSESPTKETNAHLVHSTSFSPSSGPERDC